MQIKKIGDLSGGQKRVFIAKGTLFQIQNYAFG